MERQKVVGLELPGLRLVSNDQDKLVDRSDDEMQVLRGEDVSLR